MMVSLKKTFNAPDVDALAKRWLSLIHISRFMILYNIYSHTRMKKNHQLVKIKMSQRHDAIVSVCQRRDAIHHDVSFVIIGRKADFINLFSVYCVVSWPEVQKSSDSTGFIL